MTRVSNPTVPDRMPVSPPPPTQATTAQAATAEAATADGAVPHAADVHVATADAAADTGTASARSSWRDGRAPAASPLPSPHAAASAVSSDLSGVTASAALLAANERLRAQQAAHRRDKQPRPSPPSTAARPATAGIWTHLPAHLGWESAAVTAVQRRAIAGGTTLAATVLSASPPALSDSAPYGLRPDVSGSASAGTVTAAPTDKAAPVAAAHPPTPPATTTICLPPSLAMALLRTGQTACGRLWLLLRHLDSAGCGCLPLTAVQTALTGRDSPLRLCGPRRLRQLLQQGKGLFWQRDREHLWLAGTVKVAARLGVSRLAGRPVALPLAALTQPIGLVRAHLYAAFHSSRAGCGQAQGGQPISRAALTAVSGLSRRSQHAYERRARVRVSRNMAIGPRLTPSTREAVAWQQGAAVFIVTDKPGQQGRPGQRYLAWQLPNSYQGPHARLSRGRNRRRNRQLADLCIYGDAGNGQGKAVVVPGGRRYVGNGATAGRHSLEHPEVQVYWQAGRRRRGVWYLLRANLAESPSVVREARTTAPPDQNGIGDGRRA